MNITYNENPLKTTVDLSEEEKKVLWYKIKINFLEEQIWEAHFQLTENKNIDNAIYHLEEKNIDTIIDSQLDDYLKALQDTHAGDCISVPCSCLKCMAESELGIDTLEGIYKTNLTIINFAFERYFTIDQVLEYLKLTSGISYNWLLNYKITKLKLC